MNKLEVQESNEALPPFDPNIAVGGIWVANERRHVPVHLKGEPFTDEHYGFTIYEYADDSDEMRGSLLEVPAGGLTPAWHLLREGNFGYLEIHQVVDGNGTMIIQGDPDDATRSGWWRDESGSNYFDARGAMHPLIHGEETGIVLKPGEAFQVIADQDDPIRILTTFPQKPFDINGEERIGSLI